MPKALKVVLAVLVVLAVALGGASFYLAKSVARPNGNSLAEEQAWEEDHGMWGDFAELPREDFTVAGEGGYTLHCSLVPAAEASDRYVIISHGYNANRYGAAKYVTAYRDLGFNCIIYDVRGHGENEPTTCTLGQLESQDLLAIIADTRARHGDDITLGLHGESMGSAISLSALGRGTDVDFVVADCGFANLYELLQGGLDQNHLGWMMPLANAASQAVYGFDMSKTSPIDALAGNQIPICFIHGAEDPYILPDNSKRLQAATSGYSELHLVPGAKHAESREVLGKDAYRDIIAGFLQHVSLGG